MIVINAEKVKTTGMKSEQKVYQHYTGYPGGLRTEEFRKRFERKPELIIEDAILRMLPKTKLGRQMITKLKVYRGDKHPHEAQKPEAKALEATSVSWLYARSSQATLVRVSRFRDLFERFSTESWFGSANG